MFIFTIVILCLSSAEIFLYSVVAIMTESNVLVYSLYAENNEDADDMTDFKANFKGKYEDLMCADYRKEIETTDTTEHVIQCNE